MASESHKLKHRQFGGSRTRKRSSSMTPSLMATVPEAKPVVQNHFIRRRRNASCPPVFTGLPTVSIDHLRETKIYDLLVAQDEESRIISAAFNAAQDEGQRLRQLQDSEPIVPVNYATRSLKEDRVPDLSDLLKLADEALAVDDDKKKNMDDKKKNNHDNHGPDDGGKTLLPKQEEEEEDDLDDDDDEELKREEASDAADQPPPRRQRPRRLLVLLLALLVVAATVAALFFRVVVVVDDKSDDDKSRRVQQEDTPLQEEALCLSSASSSASSSAELPPPPRVPQLVLAPLEPYVDTRRRKPFRGFWATLVRNRAKDLLDQDADLSLVPSDYNNNGNNNEYRPIVPTIVG